MTMLIKRYTISNGVTSTTTRDGLETGRIVHSEPGFTADIMVESNDEYATRERPRRLHISLSMEIDALPNMTSGELQGWLRDRLLEMLPDRQ